MSRLPEFVIIGAQRSGTTTLFRHLSEHPSIFMPEEKELHYFDRNFNRGVDWYRDRFAGAAPHQRTGEATPRYMSVPKAIDRMASVIPDALLVAILRDPVDRTYSQFWMERIRGRVHGTFEQYLGSQPDPLAASRYVDQLRYVCSRFPRNQLLVLLYEDLRDRPRDTYAQACAFIGVETDYAPASLGRAINRYVEFRSMRVRDWSKRLPKSVHLLSRVVDRLNTNTHASYPPMRSETRAMLAERFSHSNLELAEWLGRDVASWTDAPQRDKRA